MEVNKNMKIDEEKEPTKKLDNINNIVSPSIEEDDEDFLDIGDRKKENDKFVLSETREYIFNNTEKEDEPVKRIQKQENNNYEQPKEVVREPEKKKMNKLVIPIIILIIAIVTVIITIILISKKDDNTSSNTNKKSSKENSYVTAISTSLKNGTLDKEIKKSMKSAGVDTDKVKMVSLDIDSDKQQELVIYAEDDTNKFILHFEVDEDVYLEDSYQVDSSQSIGYAYSLLDKDVYYYTEYNGLYTIIGYTKLVVKEDDFLNDYFPITKEYKKKPFLDNTITYNLDKDLDVKSLDEDKITSKTILEDNDTTLIKISEAADKYVEEREAAKKAKEEEERKLKEEEEAAKKAAKTLSLNENSLHYGKYLPSKKGEITKLTFNEDGTGTINDTLCTWEEGNKALLTNEEIPVLTFTCDDKTYDLTSFNNDSLSNGKNIELSYAE